MMDFPSNSRHAIKKHTEREHGEKKHAENRDDLEYRVGEGGFKVNLIITYCRQFIYRHAEYFSIPRLLPCWELCRV